jgi:phosphate-selective porin OprO/OprP
LEYSFGVWNGNDRTPWQGNPKDYDRDNNKDKDYGGRLQVNPFRTTDNWWLKGIQLGGWFNQGHEEDVPSSTQSVLTFSTAPGTTWFRTAAGNVRADGDRSRIGWDGTWFLGPVCVAGEMEWMRQNFKNVNPASIVGPPTPNAGLWNANGVGWQNQILPFNAWLVQASWLLTGEDATFSGVKPKNDFDPKKGTWGAFELAARYSRLDIGQHVFDWFNAYPSSYAYIANQANSSNGAGELTLGLNWYLNKNVKLMFNYVYTALDSAVPVSRPSGFGGSKLFKDEDAFLMRAQVKW